MDRFLDWVESTHDWAISKFVTETSTVKAYLFRLPIVWLTTGLTIFGLLLLKVWNWLKQPKA